MRSLYPVGVVPSRTTAPLSGVFTARQGKRVTSFRAPAEDDSDICVVTASPVKYDGEKEAVKTARVTDDQIRFCTAVTRPSHPLHPAQFIQLWEKWTGGGDEAVDTSKEVTSSRRLHYNASWVIATQILSTHKQTAQGGRQAVMREMERLINTAAYRCCCCTALRAILLIPRLADYAAHFSLPFHYTSSGDYGHHLNAWTSLSHTHFMYRKQHVVTTWLTYTHEP